MFEQTFKNIDDTLHKDAGCSSELDYTEQTSWMLFLKYLDDLEHEKSLNAELLGEEYQFIIDKDHRWTSWAAPKDAKGDFDHNNALTGDDLMDYVDTELFPYLKGFKQRAESPNSIEYKIGEIFGEIKNKIQSGYSLRDCLEKVDELRFRSQAEKHELSHLYETKIKNMGNAGRNGGEYYTPRPLIRAMIDVIQPKIGETIYDGAAGSAGFLCEAFDYLRKGGADKKPVSPNELKILQENTFYAKEKKSLAYVIAIMNMILHGIEAPNVIHTNTLAQDISDLQAYDKHEIILANPPFGGKERKEIQQNFTIKTGETAFLFLQHFIKSLKPGGRAAIVIKNTFLSNTDNANIALRKELLESCNLHTVLDCPAGTFIGAGVKTVVLFFEKGSSTQKTWFYQLTPGRNMGKTNPLNDNDLKEFVNLQKTKSNTDKSWSVDINDINSSAWDLAVNNPKVEVAEELEKPKLSINDLISSNSESIPLKQLKSINDSYEEYLSEIFSGFKSGWESIELSNICQNLDNIRVPITKKDRKEGPFPYYGASGIVDYVDDYLFDESLLLVSEDGANLLARTYPIAFSASGKYWVNNHAHVLKFTNKYMQQFIEYYLNSISLKPYVTGMAQPKLNKKSLNSIPVPKVSDEVAEKIVKNLEALSTEVNEIREIYQQKLDKLESLNKSIFKQTFNGELA